MASVLDVSAYILSHSGDITANKLQKLAYYCQAWSLVWDDEAIFHERIEAWANGPVIVELFLEHEQEFLASSEPKGRVDRLTTDNCETIDAVLKYYGDKAFQWLSELAKSEDPWKVARRDTPNREREGAEITLKSMGNYYRYLTD